MRRIMVMLVGTALVVPTVGDVGGFPRAAAPTAERNEAAVGCTCTTRRGCQRGGSPGPRNCEKIARRTSAAWAAIRPARSAWAPTMRKSSASSRASTVAPAAKPIATASPTCTIVRRDLHGGHQFRPSMLDLRHGPVRGTKPLSAPALSTSAHRVPDGLAAEEHEPRWLTSRFFGAVVRSRGDHSRRATAHRTGSGATHVRTATGQSACSRTPMTVTLGQRRVGHHEVLPDHAVPPVDDDPSCRLIRGSEALHVQKQCARVVLGPVEPPGE
jgi:hypothetical protein